MGVKKFKPTSPGRRFASVSDFSEITKDRPEKSLTAPISKTGGRNNYGRITTRHIGGGHKRKYRAIDFKRNKDGVPARVASIEYDPNRSARIALLNYFDGEKRYILSPQTLKVGDELISGEEAEIKVGNALQMGNIPLGSIIHAIEMQPNKGAQMARSAGTSAQLVAKEGDYVQLKLPSGEVRMVLKRCRATLGNVGNPEHEILTVGKAGKSRWQGKRPTTRGTVMNPVDHPHGGGEGKSKGNLPVTPWGKPTLGYRTRKSKQSDKLIVRRRKRKR